MPEILGRDCELGPRHPHGSNIYKKINDRDIASDQSKLRLIQGIAKRYLSWRDAALSIDFSDEQLFVEQQTLLYQEHRDFLDEPRIDAFDSRGALQPSALEEFCYFLFRPLVSDYGDSVSVGHHDVFQGMYFTSPNFKEFSVMPTPRYPVGNLDFVIGKKLESRIATEEAHTVSNIYVPAVAVECKTYLDRPRYIESDILARNIKHGFPGCLYIVISEFLKLDLSKVSVIGSSIDKIYVFRRAQNVDRKIRRAKNTTLSPIHIPAVYDFFGQVKQHLKEDWLSPENWSDTGVLK